MAKKKLKQFIALTTALSFTTNTFGYAAVGLTGSKTSNNKSNSSVWSENLVKQEDSEGTSKISDAINTESDEVISVIVEFVSEPIALGLNTPAKASADTGMKVARDHEVFEQFLEKLPAPTSGESIGITQSYSIIYNGVALTIKASDVEKLLDCSVVKKIHADAEVTFDTTIDSTITVGEESDPASEGESVETPVEAETQIPSEEGTQTPSEEESVETQVEEGTQTPSEEEGVETPIEEETQTPSEESLDNNESVVEETETEQLEQELIEPYMMDSLPFLSIDDLHKEGITGDGIKVGVLDTGIDYNHPDLADVYKGFKSTDGDATNQDINSIKGWDFVDNDADPMETTYSDWQVSGQPEQNYNGDSYYTSHGTHVSGTIAGQQANTGNNAVLGVAPNVDLYAYRVLGPYGSGATSGIVAAIEKSVTDGMDVINMSLGASSLNDPFNPLVDAVNNATLAGVIPVISSGNSGPNSGTIGSPGTAQLPITVGASTVDFNYATFDLHFGNESLNASMMAMDLGSSVNELLNKELEMVYCGLGGEEDFEGQDLTGKVAVIDRGTHTFVNKIKNAKEAGAVLVIMINNVEGSLPYLGELNGVNTLALSLADGEILKENLDQFITLSPAESILEKGDQLTDFSSVGPVQTTSEIKPDVIAPGYQVFSTVPEYINDPAEGENYEIAYQRMSGTSMAAPHVTGIVALFLQENPNYSPSDVKAALMNTADIITGEYSVHQIGAGRVNPYKAVHETVSFKAEYPVIAGANYTEINNITSMLSYGKVYQVNGDVATKAIPITIENRSDSSKTYDVTVQFGNNDRSLSASANNVTLNLEQQVTVGANSQQTFDAVIEIPSSAEYGNYEGYIYFVEVGNEENSYQMPFAASFSKEGIVSLDYPAMEDEYAKGISAFNTSAQLNKYPNTYFTGSDVQLAITVSEPITVVKTYVKDEKGELVGFGGSQDGSWILENQAALISNLISNGCVNKIVDGKVSHEQIPLKAGIYELEVVIKTVMGKEFKDSLPVAIINDTYSDQVTFYLNDTELSEGVIEVNDSLYSSEQWYDDEVHEAIWVRANVYNDIVHQMKKEKGLDYLKQSELNAVYAYGIYPNESQMQIGTMSEADGNVLIAGIEKEDLTNGYFHLKLDYTNVGSVTARPHHFVFVNPDTQYLSIETDQTILNEHSEVKAVIKAHNLNELMEGQFKIENRGDALLNIKSLTVTEELKDLLNAENITLDYSKLEEDLEDAVEEFNISFTLPEGVNGDIELFEIVFEVDEFRGVDSDLVDSEQFIYTTLLGKDGLFKDANQEELDVKTGTLVQSFDLESIERTLIYGQVNLPAAGLQGGEIVAIAPNGTKYKPTYAKLDDWTERSYLFTFNDLPIIDGEYKLVYTMPGAFDSVLSVPGSKVNAKGETVGNLFGVVSYTFYSQSALTSILGDVNGDGAIDVVDAYLVGQEYVAEIPEAQTRAGSNADLNQDGVVNYYDMSYITSNYMIQDLTRPDSATPQETYNGNDIYDILEDCGYFDEDPENNVVLELSSEESTVGEEVVLTAIPPVDGIEFEYEFSIREKNDSKWTVLQEKSESNTIVWTPELAGEYAVKVRIFYDEINYVWQDNKVHIVKPLAYSIPEGLQAYLDLNYLLPIEGDASEKAPLHLQISADVNHSQALSVIQSLCDAFEVTVIKNDLTYSIILSGEGQQYYLKLSVHETLEAIIDYLDSLVNQPGDGGEGNPDQPGDGEDNESGNSDYSIPEGLKAVLDTNYLLPVKGDGSKETPLQLEVKGETDQAKALKAMKALFKGYDVAVTKNGKVYSVVLYDKHDCYYLTVTVDETSQDIIKYLDSLISQPKEDTPQPDKNNNTQKPTKPNHVVTGLAGGLVLLTIGGGCVIMGVKVRKKKEN